MAKSGRWTSKLLVDLKVFTVAVRAQNSVKPTSDHICLTLLMLLLLAELTMVLLSHFHRQTNESAASAGVNLIKKHVNQVKCFHKS